MPKGTRIAENVNPPAGGAPTSGGALLAGSLPCLYSNNVTEVTPGSCQELETTLGLCNLLSPYHKRQAHTLFSNVHRLVTKVAPSPGHVGFLTITTPDVTDNSELRERWRSFTTHFLKPHPDFGEWVNTKEVQKRGAWHFHLVIVLSQDIREGVDFEQVAKGNYSSASPFLRRIWKELREALPLYGFGRSELLPVKSNADGIARYVGKYISKHIGTRAEEHKGVRLISYSTGWERNSIRFAWNTKNASEWRRKLALFAKHHGCQEFYQLSAKLGPGWAYRYAQDIMNIDDLENERTFNESQGIKQEPLPVYQDRTLKESQTRKAERERYCLIKRKIHTEIKKDYTESKKKIELAKQEVKPWVQNLNGREIEKTHEYDEGMVGIVEGQLIYMHGRQVGTILF